MSKDGKQETTSTNASLPNAPEWVTGGVEALNAAILNLGKRDPKDFVPGATSTQSQAFDLARGIGSRYGASPVPMVQAATPDSIVLPDNGSSSGSGLFASLGVQEPDTTQYDWENIFNNRPDLQTAYEGLTPQQRRDIAQVQGIPTGNINHEDFTRFHFENHPITEDGRRQAQELSRPNTGGSKGGDPRSGQPGRDIILGPDLRVQAGPAPSGGSGPGFNPLDYYTQSAAGTRAGATAGANLTDSSDVFELLLNGEGAPNVKAGRVSAQSLLDNLQKYISPHIDNVVDTTLANYDEQAARTRAQRAAVAAGTGAHRGTRNSIYEAILEGEIGRERANTEATLRDQAFTTGASLSADDANRRQSASSANAELAQRASESNAQMDLTRMLNAANMMFSEDQFNAGQEDRSLDRLMQGSRDLTNIASTYQGNERADIGLIAELGERERSIAQQEANAELGLLSTISNLLGNQRYEQVTGQVGSGTQTTRTSPGLLDYIKTGTGLLGAHKDIAGWKELFE